MPNQTNIIAIDPGASGGIAIQTEHGEDDVFSQAMPDDVALTGILQQYGPGVTIDGQKPRVVCYMEQVGGFIGGTRNGVKQNLANGSAMFNFGDGFGFIRGLCAGLGIRLILVRPQLWQKGIAWAGSAKDKAERKRAYKEHAARLFPGLTPTLKTADALCLLDYAMRQENGTKPATLSVQPTPVNVAKPSKKARYSEARAAIDWCKRNHWNVPLTGTAEFNRMIDCYRESKVDAFLKQHSAS